LIAADVAGRIEALPHAHDDVTAGNDSTFVGGRDE
jgi:hypothetical protein